jgi:hypothetical protein
MLKKKVKILIPLEIDEQKAFIKWLESKKIEYFAVPNVVTLAIYLKTRSQKINFWKMRKKEGVKKGVPDLVVFLENVTLFVEMKRQGLSKTSDEQKAWNTLINKLPHCKAVICKGASAAIDSTLEAMIE